MWRKTVWIGHPMRLELTRESLLVYLTITLLEEPQLKIIVIYKAFCSDVAQERMNGAPNKTRTHFCRFACQPW